MKLETQVNLFKVLCIIAVILLLLVSSIRFVNKPCICEECEVCEVCEVCDPCNTTKIIPAEFVTVNTTKFVEEINNSSPTWVMYAKVVGGDVIIAIPFLREGNNVYNRIILNESLAE